MDRIARLWEILNTNPLNRYVYEQNWQIDCWRKSVSWPKMDHPVAIERCLRALDESDFGIGHPLPIHCGQKLWSHTSASKLFDHIRQFRHTQVIPVANIFNVSTSRLSERLISQQQLFHFYPEDSKNLWHAKWVAKTFEMKNIGDNPDDQVHALYDISAQDV